LAGAPRRAQGILRPGDRPGYSRTQLEAAQVKATIFGHPEFSAFNAR